MKKCPWCGKDYDDGASVCLADQTPLEPCARASSPFEEGRRDVGSRGRTGRIGSGIQTAQPWSVVVGVVLLLVTSSLQFQHSVARVLKGGSLVYDGPLLDAVLLLVPLWFTFRGRSWARWIWVIYVVGGVAVSVQPLIQHLQAGAVHWVVGFCLRSLVVCLAVIVLFLPLSNQWFREHRNAKTG